MLLGAELSSVIASESQWGPEPLLAIVLASGKKSVCSMCVCVSVFVLQPQTNDVFDLLFVLKQRGACGRVPRAHTHNTHTYRKCEECESV